MIRKSRKGERYKSPKEWVIRRIPPQEDSMKVNHLKAWVIALYRSHKFEIVDVELDELIAKKRAEEWAKNLAKEAETDVRTQPGEVVYWQVMLATTAEAIDRTS